MVFKGHIYTLVTLRVLSVLVYPSYKKTIKYYKTFKLTVHGDMSLSPELSVVGSNRVCDPKIVALSLRVVRVHLYVSEVCRNT